MSTAAQRATPPEPHPLIGHATPEAILARRQGQPILAAQFLADVAHVAAHLPDARHVLNACADRYRFAVLLAAAILRGQLTLLPPATTPGVIRALLELAPDAYCMSDDPGCAIEMPRVAYPRTALSLGRGGGDEGHAFPIPPIDAAQAIACVFTSGSTGEPQPHLKTWGAMVRDVRAEAARLGITPAHAVLGTVPPQHMYGFESTVLLPLVTGATLTAERLYYPADIDAAIGRSPAPRVLFTTPFHLRAWLESGSPAPLERIVSATAPLSQALAQQAEATTGAVLHEIYGCTEAGQVATRRSSQTQEWQAYEGVRVWNDAHGQAMCAGGHVETATPLQDVIQPLGDGSRFTLQGRTADLVNIAGKRNSIGYLNHQLLAIAGVQDGTFYLPDDADPDGVTRLMAFVVAPALSSAQVMAALRGALDPAFLPRPLVMVERLPRQLTGKIARDALRALAREAGR